MPTLKPKEYDAESLRKIASHVRRHATELERIAEFLEENGLETLPINYGTGVVTALHKISLFTMDADRASLDSIMED